MMNRFNGGLKLGRGENENTEVAVVWEKKMPEIPCSEGTVSIMTVGWIYELT